MPVAQSDPRRATLIGIIGIVFGVAMVGAVLLLQNTGGGSETTRLGNAEFGIGKAEDRTDDTPFILPDTASFNRPIYLNHVGDEPDEGWFAFDAVPPGCQISMTWDSDEKHFVDCHGVSYGPDGRGLQQYAIAVDEDGDLVVNVNPDAATSTTSTTTTSILITGSD